MQQEEICYSSRRVIEGGNSPLMDENYLMFVRIYHLYLSLGFIYLRDDVIM